MPDVISLAPADARLFVALDVHKLSIVAGTRPPAGGQPPTPETEGLRDLLRCRDDIRCARTAARHRVSKLAAAPRAGVPRGQEVLDEGAHGVGAPPAAERSARARRA